MRAERLCIPQTVDKNNCLKFDENETVFHNIRWVPFDRILNVYCSGTL